MNPVAPANILVLEDDAGIALLERKTLERAGYTVTTVATTQAADECLTTQPPALLVLDYRLAEIGTGLDYYRRLRERGTDLPAILVTGFSDEAKIIEALRTGIRDVVPKGDHYLDYLPEAVGRVLRQVAAEEDLRRSEAELKRAQHLARVGNWSWTVDTQTLTWSGELYRIFGRDPARPPGSRAGSPPQSTQPRVPSARVNSRSSSKRWLPARACRTAASSRA